ncbi:MAG: hypothetical protein KF777_07650 [Planctomycetaceae bacterium]|nr:hypothetical protein [Planctomycetaceae bacterium]
MSEVMQSRGGVMSRILLSRWLMLAVAAGWGFAATPSWGQAPVGGAPKSKTPAATKPAPKAPSAPTTKTPAAASQPADPSALPPGYVPPKVPADLALMEQPIATPDEIESLKRSINAFKSALNKGEAAGAAGKDLIRKGIRYRLALMTLKANRDQIGTFREDLTVRELQSAGRLLRKADETTEFRRLVMQEVVDQSRELLQNNLYVRIQAALILGELNLTEADPKKGLTTVGFGPAIDPLVDVILDPNQPESVKIVAVNGIYRQLRTSQPEAKLKIKLADALVKEFSRTDTHFWYQWRLAAAISALDVSLDFNREPFVANALIQAVGDDKRQWIVRAEAAHALGRVPLEPSVNFDRLLFSIGQMAHGLGVARNADEKGNGALDWARCFRQLYLAFQPLDAKDMTADGKLKAGLLNRPTNQAATRELYQQILPIVNAGLNGEKIPDPALAALDAWVKKNTPAGAGVAQGNSGTTP